MKGTQTADPYDYLYLGKAYQTIKDKKRAANAYLSFLNTANFGFEIDEEDIKQAKKALEQLEQK
jgi:hypothetical protein